MDDKNVLVKWNESGLSLPTILIYTKKGKTDYIPESIAIELSGKGICTLIKDNTIDIQRPKTKQKQKNKKTGGK